MAEYLTRCEKIVTDELGNNLTEDQRDELSTAFRDLENHINEIRAADASLTSEDAALQAAENLVQQKKLAKAIETHQKLINLKIKAKTRNFVLNTTYGEAKTFRPDLSLSAIMVGGNEAEAGSRASVFREQKSLEGKYVSGIMRDLDKTGLKKEIASGTYDRETADAMWRMGNNQPLTGLSKESIEIAKIYSKWSEISRLDKNKAGAWVRKLPGYITRQSHDPYKIRAAGYDAWRESILPKLDKATFAGVKDQELFLQNIYKSLSSGIHLTNDPKADWLSGFKGGGSNIAKRASQERVLQFKDGKSWFDYNQQFGTGNLRDSIMNGLRHSANTTGLMRVMGTNPENMFDYLYKQAQLKLREVGGPDAEEAFAGKKHGLENQLKQITGVTNIPGNKTLALVGSELRAFESMTKLGNSLVSQFSDLGNAALELKYQGRGFFDSLQSMITAKFSRYKADDQKEILSHIGVFCDGMREEMISKAAGDPVQPGWFSRNQGKFFKYNLMSWWTENTRSGLGLMMSNHLANNAGKTFDQLGPEISRVLEMSGIGPKQWDIYRKMNFDELRGNKHMTADNVNSVPDSVIADYVQSNGLKVSPTSISAAREELASTLRGYYLDRIMVAMAEPGARTQAFMKQGTQAGTPIGEALRFVGQFKSFTASFMQNVMGRELFGKGYSPAPLGSKNMALNSLKNALMHGNGEKQGLAQLFVAATAFGYISMQAKLLVKGQTPRPINRATVMAAMAQGGGLGILGDYLFSEYNRFGSGPVTSLAGPVIGDVGNAITLWQKIASGDAKAMDAFRFAIDHTPYANLHVVRPALNYLILNQMQETLSPGSLDRYQSAIEKQNNNTFIIPPSQMNIWR